MINIKYKNKHNQSNPADKKAADLHVMVFLKNHLFWESINGSNAAKPNC
jgi:hypothetical protein